MSKLSSYLAKKYLTAEPSSSSTSSKKRKRKTPKENTGLIIADDDDDSSWRDAKISSKDDEDDPQYASGRTAEFRKAKKNAWKVVGGLAPTFASLDGNSGMTGGGDDSREADAIIAQAARENAESGDKDEEPVIEGTEIEEESVVKMGDGTHAGLQRASDVSAQMEKRKAEEIARWEAEEAAAGRAGKRRGKASAEETVYRDATGRRIDITLRRAEARKELEAAEKREREKLEDAKGDVQKVKERERRELLEEAKFMPLARGVDDVDMNDELRSRERWNDPAAMFLSEKGTGGAATKGKGKARMGKKSYDGAAAPNRYGIRPGWRWDGVDRGNGWEGERFKELNRKTRNKDLDFAWQMDT